MDERHITVAKTARYITLGDGGDGGEGGDGDVREVWFVMHGYGQLAPRFMKRFQSMVGEGRLIVAPEALNRYYFETSPGVHAADAGVGATWMTREEREYEIADYVAYLDRLYEAVIGGLRRSPARIAALGFSQGAATAARWVARGQARLTDVMLCGGFLPPEIEPSPHALKGASLALIHGRQDPYASESRIAQESARLRAGGLPHRVTPFEGVHEISDAAINAILATDPS